MSVAPYFLTRYVPDEAGCWIWQGATDKAAGYGRMTKGGLAHRRFYEAFKGDIPYGLTIDHLCKVRNCVNPDHLEAVTLRENIRRSDNPTGLNARKTHCKRGHEFTPENTRARTDTAGRMCITCNRAYQRKVYAAAKAAA